MEKKRVFLNGENIYLRPLEKNDIEGNYVHWFDDEEVCRYNEHHRFPYFRESLLSFVDNLKDNFSKVVFAIISKPEGKHIGNVSLQNINYLNRSAEFAIIIGEKDFWGKGYATETMKLIIKYAFMDLNLRRIHCGTSDKNINMQKLAERFNFQKEGVRRQALYKSGHYTDIIEYGLLKDDFEIIKV